MAGNSYKLKFNLSDGTTQEVAFTAPQGEKGDTPVKGTDYWTESDKEEMVSDVLAALTSAEGVAF